MTTTSLFSIPGMDCPSEERLIRLALAPAGEVSLAFDLGRRELRVTHEGPIEPIASRLASLELGARLLSSGIITAPPGSSMGLQAESAAGEAGVLKWLLAINAALFLIEFSVGWLAQSMGLIADSLDMLADAGVYGLALYAVGRSARYQLTAARLSGWLQVLLAVGAMSEVGRRFVFGSEPQPGLMMSISLLALAANVLCLLLLARHRNGGLHMKASWIFSTNDVLANVGVIIAGAMVAWTGSNYPDLVIGALIALLVLNGARRILRLSA